MSLDQLLRDAAHGLADQVTPPPVDLDLVRRRARAGQRRTAALVAAAAVAALALGAVVVDTRDSSMPDPVMPTPTPTGTASPTSTPSRWSPDSVTPEEVVRADDARVSIVGVGLADTDTRLSLWSADGTTGVAVTTDGYRTTTYTSLPSTDYLVDARAVTEDLFLLTDANDTVEWLVGSDGTARAVTRKRGEVLPADDRLWFQCTHDGLWRSTWCALDPTTATAYMWPDAWDGSAVPPGEGVVPWGANPRPRAVGSTGQLEVWWGTGSDTQVRNLGAAEGGDYVLGCPPDVMALWGASGSRVDVHTSRDGGATWQVTSYDAPGAADLWRVRCAPDGSYLGVAMGRGTTVFRAEGGAFREVLAAPGTADSLGEADVWADGGRVFAGGEGFFAVSDDSGRTWTKVRTWR